MAPKSIPQDVRQQVEQAVARFNDEHFTDGDVRYVARFKGLYLYLDRCDFGNTGAICRLKYTGDCQDWEFAIFKYSSERYDPDEWFFPGSEAVDGTIEGSMLAGLEAYPP
jgi:hypothetical protein